MIICSNLDDLTWTNQLSLAIDDTDIVALHTHTHTHTHVGTTITLDYASAVMTTHTAHKPPDTTASSTDVLTTRIMCTR